MGSKLEYLAPKGARGKGSLPNTASTGGASTNKVSGVGGSTVPKPGIKQQGTTNPLTQGNNSSATGKTVRFSKGVGEPQLPQKLSTPGSVIRSDAIPTGSNLEYLAPGRVRFDGVEFRAVRDLGHLSETELRTMQKFGNNAIDIDGKPLVGHHNKQQFHREPGAFIVEMPGGSKEAGGKHSIGNRIQHPHGNKKGMGLTKDQRNKDWNPLNKKVNSERARTELLRRGIND